MQIAACVDMCSPKKWVGFINQTRRKSILGWKHEFRE
jgi:hypothetical protein